MQVGVEIEQQAKEHHIRQPMAKIDHISAFSVLSSRSNRVRFKAFPITTTALVQIALLGDNNDTIAEEGAYDNRRIGRVGRRL